MNAIVSVCLVACVACVNEMFVYFLNSNIFFRLKQIMSNPNSSPNSRRSRSPLRDINNAPRRDSPRESAPSLPAPQANNNIRYKYIAGQRINSKLLHALDEHQICKRKVQSKHDIQFECYRSLSGCLAKVFIDIATNECYSKVKHRLPHNHGSMRQEIAEMTLKNDIKKKCG